MPETAPTPPTNSRSEKEPMPASQPILITGAAPLGGEATDILVQDGRITAVGTHLTTHGAEVIDAAGLVALPGLVDLHTHLRQPGNAQAETVLSGSRAAAVGGYTCVHAMANTEPASDTAGIVDEVYRLGLDAGYVEVRPIGAVSAGLKGERLAEIGAMAGSHAQVRVFSDDGHCVASSLLMRRALEYVRAFGGVVADHPQDDELTIDAQMNESELSSRLGLTGWPTVAEEDIVARDILIANHVHSRIHICHVSTAGSVDLIRWAKQRGMPVTAEVTPHHLLLPEDLVGGFDANFKVNPPLRSQEDIDAVRLAVADGTIDVVATDHAPHPADHKDCEWHAAACGMLGLQHALRIVQLTLVDTGLIGWEDAARIMSSAPARIGSVADQGQPIAVGSPANLTLYDPAAESTVTADEIVSISDNSPYLGMSLPGSVRDVLFRGRPTVRDGVLQDLNGPAAPTLSSPTASASEGAHA